MQETITVLLVDEDQDILDITKTFLEREDNSLDVEPVTETSEALGTLEERSDDIDCVISDYSMPEMNGVEFLESVRERVPDIPFFFFTGRDQAHLEEELGDESPDGYVQKGTGTDRYVDLAADIRDTVK